MHRTSKVALVGALCFAAATLLARFIPQIVGVRPIAIPRPSRPIVPFVPEPEPRQAPRVLELSPVSSSRKNAFAPVRELVHIAVLAARAWSHHRASSKGAALALYTLLSLAPMLILILAVAGLVIDRAALQDNLLIQVQGLVGAEGRDAVKAILSASTQKHQGIVAGMVSAIVVMVSATSAFSELKYSLDELWGVNEATDDFWQMLRERVLSFGLLLVLALMLIFSLGVSAALAAISAELGNTTGVLLGQLGAEAFGFLIVTLLFAIILKFLPATKIAWSDVAIGAFITALLFSAGKAIIGFYLTHGGVGSGFGAAGSVVGLVVWVYYSSQIFFYGSLFTHEYAIHLGSRRAASSQRLPPS